MSRSSIRSFFCAHPSEQHSRCYAVLGIFIAVSLVVLGYAFYTDHRWEDWYITYRASKNLALGNGLVFTPGEHVHSFTSPIGTLIPAFLAVITRANDEMVIWLYRIISALMLGAAAVQLYRIAEFFRFGALARIFMIGLLATNLLMIDFSINGMETAFMLFGLIYYTRILICRPDQLLRKLALAIAYLMYTRPDSFVYAGAITLGLFVFEPTLNGYVKDRRAFLLMFLKAGGVALLLYAPWVLWSWSYYGTPVPHTITAKSVLRIYDWQLLADFFKYPFTMIGRTVLSYVFLPPYAAMGWGSGVVVLSILMSMLCFAVLAWPRGSNPYARALALASLLVAFYLDRISGQGGMPWYVPNLGIILFLMFGLLYHSLMAGANGGGIKRYATVIAGLMLLLNIGMLAVGAEELKHQQDIIETGNRKKIGLWLNAHAKTPHDTVFLECLGYIGFYSNLKMYDYPGMSSPESVAAIRKLKDDGEPIHYNGIIKQLHPDWLVLRFSEMNRMNAIDPSTLRDHYTQRADFDVTDQIPESLPGRDYLLFDAHFIVFERNR